ncbi:hypothetical protein [Ignavibacterium album]|uniref:hypothetical protein n=1 Tax=Ignavibacterium album TaxID=591197 RepID=UPI0035B85717
MNNPSSIKNCPFCKSQIPVNAEKCPICKITLIERVERVKREEYHSIDKQSKVDNNYKNSSTIKNKFNFLVKDYATKIFDFLKRKKVIIAFSSVVILLIFYFVQSNKSSIPGKTLYNYELEGKNKPNEEKKPSSANDDNNLNNYTPSQIDKETTSKSDNISLNNRETKDFSNIPEKYIPNGKIFFKNKRYFTGLGELTIKNGTNNDAVLKLVSNNINKSVLTVYVRRNSNFTIKKIKDGNYKLFFVVGRHYDEDSLIFLQDCSFAVFEEDFPFITDKYRLKDKIKTEYSIFEITLHPVIGGKARTNEIAKNEFLLL